MGAVCRATDSKLNRDVAIKVLPDAFAQDTARMQRFEREAQLLAALNHPNIAAIYGVEQGALVMELVEGTNLRGPVPSETAIGYAKQIAAGLEAAHEKASSTATSSPPTSGSPTKAQSRFSITGTGRRLRFKSVANR
jgi:serine/threonine-protein kinase